MNEKKETVILDDYTNWVHRFGRTGALIAILYMVFIPIAIALAYDSFPPLSAILKGGIGVMALFIPIGISEVISYTPILGSASYLTFLTGNILNLKLPCVLNALKLAKADQNTPEGDAIATVAVAASSILTMLIIALGVLLLVPLQPLFQTAFVKSATSYMLPALFGGMFLGILGPEQGSFRIKNKLLIMIVPVVIVSITVITGILISGLEGVAILLMLPIAIGIARILWKKGIVQVVTNEVKED
ncbi:MAG: hypothetical protein PWP38_3078 [Clostridiales bacterium]|nr:hypothetical protein [Clostridiales bacterium]